ncbi:MAG: HAD-IIB family hydrolase [Oscillospiraceae bacterium]|nr:HAD-IIB family hydrolase [Oscillospiraceae bacterium]
MKTLYISDLDGTLLRRDQTLSEFTVHTINSLVENGLRFSYATARSIVTASAVTMGLKLRLPVIVHNGGFMRRLEDGQIVIGNYFGDEYRYLLEDLMNNGIFPLVYSMNEGLEKFRYWAEKATPGMRAFLATRQNDPRELVVHNGECLFEGQPYYITCVDEPEHLVPFYEKYKDTFHCILYREIYSGNLFLEFMPKEASKANAAVQLKRMLGCDKLVVFGDGKNDLDLFRVADEAYAVENAEEEIKSLATAVIGSNQDDGVARWLAGAFEG